MATVQQKKIDESRIILEPEEVEIGRFPKWMRKRAMREIVGVHQWCDHWGRATIRGKECFVCEPYNLSLKEHLQIESFASEHSLNYYISANSWWFPGQTIRIVFLHND